MSARPVYGILYILIFFLILLLGLGNLGASCAIYTDTSSHYIGAIYAGIITIICGILGVFINYLPFSVTIGALITTCSVNIVATKYGYDMISGTKDLVACASHISKNGYTCGYYAPYICYGDSTYYTNAAFCEASYASSWGDNQCACVTSSSTDCHNVQGFGDCEHLTTTVQDELIAIFSLSVVSVVISFGLVAWLFYGVFMRMSSYSNDASIEGDNPKGFSKRTEVDAETIHKNNPLHNIAL